MVRRVDNEKLREGGQYAQDLETVTTGQVNLEDDDRVVLGANDDFAIVYDATDDRLEFRDITNSTTAYVPRSGSGDLTSGGGALSDSGSNTDSGDDYVLPNVADNINLQSDGEILNAQAVDTTAATINSSEIYIQNSQPSSPSDGDIWIDTS